MLAVDIPSFDVVKFPVLATPKIDGIRCILWDEGLKYCSPLTRRLKPIPCDFVRQCLRKLPAGLDGELTVGKNFNETMRGIMTQAGEPDFTFHVFDWFLDPSMTYEERVARYRRLKGLPEWVVLLEPRPVVSVPDLEDKLAAALTMGYEGLVVRGKHCKYKHGRSTIREQGMMKVKVRVNSTATVVGFDELMRNKNLAEVDARGYLGRSTDRSGMVPANTLGALVVQDCETGREFRVGTGFTDAQRESIWRNQQEWMGRVVKYCHQPAGAVDLPRAPVMVWEGEDGYWSPPMEGEGI